MKVYQAINAVQRELAKTGIEKGRKNQQQGYSFRGIDDMYNVVSPLLGAHGLCILPRVLSRECTERQSKGGGTLFNVVCEVEFDFIAAEDGSKHTVKTYGEAMDSADKATNKAMSAAYKYAVMQAFAIPTEGDNDADAHTHEVAAGMPEKIIADWLAFIQTAAPEELDKAVHDALAAAEKAKDREAYMALRAAGKKRTEHLKEKT